CPHCWRSFPPEESLWITAHDSLLGDKRLGDNEFMRFLPSRFDVGGKAIDQRGMICNDIACPNCHLKIPRPVLEFAPFFVSIAGTPACGKSYFLASMTWQLRQTLPGAFKLGFADADGECNEILATYEEDQFFYADQVSLVKLKKTEQFGTWYSQVLFDDQTITFPKPFLFTIRPQGDHPAATRQSSAARLLCLYDNAGESFGSGKDTVGNAVTRHLSVGDGWLFCFDPTQNPKFRSDHAEISQDNQMTNPKVTNRQEPVFHEMLARIRKHSLMNELDRTKKPLIILCNKYDAWWKLLGKERLPNPWKESSRDAAKLNLDLIDKVSAKMRKILFKYVPAMVSSAESFSDNCYFLPVSATGTTPQEMEGGQLGVRPRDMNPMWCDVPMLLLMAERTPSLIAKQRKN
ncbi:MAG: hypothetical protein P8J33_10160, partial [Pirellulaceae bacterium]|nr:hypothetical protein [Pirellulaceae bacterium]